MSLVCAFAISSLALLSGATQLPEEAQRLLETARTLAKSSQAVAPGTSNAAPQLKENFSTWSAEELAALEAEALRIGNSIPEREVRASFGFSLAQCLPGDTGLRLMANLALTKEKTLTDINRALWTIHNRKQPSSLAAKLVIALHQELQPMDVELDRDNPKFLAIQTLGTTGPDAVDYLIGLGAQVPDVPEALGEIGTPQALDYLMQFHRECNDDDIRRYCLRGLAGQDLLWRETKVITFVRTELTALLTGPDSEARLDAVDIAGLSGDPYFLPALDELAANDPYTKPVTRYVYDHQTKKGAVGECNAYVIREAAQENADLLRTRIRETNPELLARVSKLTETVKSLRDSISSGEKWLALERSPEELESYRRVIDESRQRLIEAKKQLPEQESALAAAQAEQDAYIRHAVAEARKAGP